MKSCVTKILNFLEQDERAVWVILFALCFYLGMTTGIHSDDYTNALNWKFGLNNLSLAEIDSIHWGYLPWYVFHSYIFKYLGFSPLGYEVLRVVFNFIAIYVLTDFFKRYTTKIASFVLASLIIFYPTHDSTTYWFTGSYITHTCLYIFLAANQINKGRYFSGFLLTVWFHLYKDVLPARLRTNLW